MFIQIEKDTYIDHTNIYLIERNIVDKNWYIYYHTQPTDNPFTPKPAYLTCNEKQAHQIRDYLNQHLHHELADYLDNLHTPA